MTEPNSRKAHLRRIGLVCRGSYPHLEELGRLAEVVLDHLPAGVTAVSAGTAR